MRILALDTSTWWGGLALLETRDRWGLPAVVAEVGLHVKDSHSVHLLRQMDWLLAEAAWPRTSLDAYVATRGPGSFTGLRVGLGTVRGLGLASGRPCLGVGTLEAMAEAYGAAERDRVPLLDAGRGEAYAARYDPCESPPIERIPPWVGPPEEAAVPRDGALPVIFGPGVDTFRDRLAAVPLEVPPGTALLRVAAGAGRVAAALLARGARDGHGLSPLYVRPADAEIKGESG